MQSSQISCGALDMRRVGLGKVGGGLERAWGTPSTSVLLPSSQKDRDACDDSALDSSTSHSAPAG